MNRRYSLLFIDSVRGRCSRARSCCGVAQAAGHLALYQEVVGSSPTPAYNVNSTGVPRFRVPLVAGVYHGRADLIRSTPRLNRARRRERRTYLDLSHARARLLLLTVEGGVSGPTFCFG